MSARIEKNNTFFRNYFKRKYPVILIHAFIWIALFSLPLLFRPGLPSMHGNPTQPLWIPIPIWTNNIFMVVAFYSNLLIFLPKFFNKKKWVYYALFTCIYITGSLSIHSFSKEIEYLFGLQGFHEFRKRTIHPWGFEFRQFSFIYSFAMVWSISIAYYLFVKLQESVRRADKVYATALQSELSFLKAQINPHFLFNTLNNIYALTLKHSDDASLAVMKLSNLMRKITSDTGLDYVPFREEERFIRDYIELQELRLTNKTRIRYEIEGDYDHLIIAPRILIPFIDNAFKYGVSNRYESEIHIQLEFKGQTLFFSISNPIHAGNSESLESSGVGLENAKRRLDLLYQNMYQLKISKTPENYQILLKIELSC